MAWYFFPTSTTPASPSAPALTQLQLDTASDTTIGTVSGQTVQQALSDRGVSLPPVTVAPTNGQTAFTLAAAPTNPALVSVEVNGVIYYAPDVTVAGTTLTWAGGFKLSTGDVVKVFSN